MNIDGVETGRKLNLSLFTNLDVPKPADADIMKGEIGSFRYDSNIKFKKTGKEIIAALGVLKAGLQTKIDTNTALIPELAAELEKHGMSPDTEFNEESCDNYYPSFGGGYMNGDTTRTEEQQKLIDRYRNCCWEVSSAKRDMKTCETMLKNIKPNQSAELTLSQCESLGF